MQAKTVKFVSGDRQLYENFKRKHVIGTGNSMVYEAENSEADIECVKEIRLEDKQSEFIFRKQIELLAKSKSIPHPNIVDYRGSYILQEQKGQFNSLKKGYIQMEKGIANLKTFLSQRKTNFSQEDILSFITSMLDCFAHLQRSEVAHRDIKPSNVLLFSEDPLYFKVCDVGAGTAVGFCDHTKQMTVIGTPYYLSPELYRAYRQKMHLVNYKVYKSDTYSLGLLFLEFCTLKKIEDRLNQQKQRIQKMIIQIKELYPNIIGLGKVLRKMLEEDVYSRYDFIQIEKYISENNLLRSKINKTISFDPQIFEKISQDKIIRINKIEQLSQLSPLVSTDNDFDRLQIHLSGVVSLKDVQKDQLDQLVNIKYMKLYELNLVVEMASISDKHIIYIAQSIEKNKTIRKLQLNFWNNQVTNVGLRPLLRAITSYALELKTLSLNVSSNSILIDNSFQQLFNFSGLDYLEYLNLNLSFCSIDCSFLPSVFRQISLCKSITTLSLNFQKTNLNQVHLGIAVKQLYKLENVEHLVLNFSCNSIREEGIYSIADLCYNLNKLSTCQLILRNSQISDKGLSEFLKTISKCPQLKDLKLNLMNNLITQKCIISSSSYIETLLNTQHLDINLSNNKLNDISFKYLCNSILVIKNITKLRLIFDACGLTQKGCLYIGRLISQEPRLEQLDISIKQSSIKLEGIQYLCAGLLKTKRLRKLRINLEGGLIGDYAAHYLASCLLKMRSLNHVDLNLESCDLSSETMENIIKAVKECYQKTEEITIDLRKNRQLKKEIIEQLKMEMENSRVAIKFDNQSQSPLSPRSSMSFLTAQ